MKRPPSRSFVSGVSSTPQRPLSPLALAAVLSLALAGCATAPTSVPPAERPGSLPPVLRGFTEPAAEPAPGARPDSAPWTLEAGSFESAYGCTVEYEYYEPTERPAEAAGSDLARGGAEPGLVVLGHGFLRDLESTRGWAEVWAGRGIRTVVVSFCNSSLFDGRHQRNADDLVAAGEFIAPGEVPIVYAGFSAGGLSALLAAGSDPRTTAYLGLDPVDSAELAATVDRLRVPALYLYGAPSSCNAENNMIGSMPEGRRIALRVPYSTHCDFEFPTDAGCARFCGSVEAPVEGEIRATIRALATAWVELQLGASRAAHEAFHATTLDALEEARRVEIVVNE